ncbi:MAG: hypothetical protein ACD_73C00558G0001 [uncultured bacterium]|nr:MAG: hypothetical protein ACD_73C00558G0001 [uncultured bacterium]
MDGEGAKCESLLTAKLSHEGKKTIYDRAIVIQCREGEKIIAADGGEKTIGIVRKGLVEIRKKNQKVALLAEGDIFGEIAFILNIPRTADVIAVMPETEVVFLSLSMINRLTNMKDQTQIWKNLAQIIAYRLSQL